MNFRSLVLVIATVSAVGCGLISPPPSDEEMLTLFQTKRAQLEQLRKMGREDEKLNAIDVNGLVEGDQGLRISESRIATYRVLMNEVGVDCGFQQSSVLQIFCIHAAGFKVHWRKGFIARESPIAPELLRSSLNRYYAEPARNTFLAREIEEGWYIYVTRE